MSNFEFLKNKAKKILKDRQTQTQTFESDVFLSYRYSPKIYDVSDLFFYYELDDKDEQNIILARAQHYIAKTVGFNRWDDLIHAYELVDRKEIVNLQPEKLTILSGKMKTNLTMVVCKNYPSCHGTYLDYKVLSPTILYGQTRIEGLERGIQAFETDYTMETIVHCIHCGKKYLYREANVVQFPDDEPLVYCKQYPECNGSLIDMIKVKKKINRRLTNRRFSFLRKVTIGHLGFLQHPTKIPINIFFFFHKGARS